MPGVPAWTLLSRPDADNLRNRTAPQNLALAHNLLAGNSGTGPAISRPGQGDIGTTPPTPRADRP